MTSASKLASVTSITVLVPAGPLAPVAPAPPPGPPPVAGGGVGRERSADRSTAPGSRMSVGRMLTSNSLGARCRGRSGPRSHRIDGDVARDALRAVDPQRQLAPARDLLRVELGHRS